MDKTVEMSAANSGTLYGNVEIRQVDLAFNSEGTVLAMQKQEGFTLAIGLIVKLEPAGRKIMASRGIFAVLGLSRDGVTNEGQGQKQKKG